MDKHREKVNKELEYIKNPKELKNRITQVKNKPNNTLEGINCRLGNTEEQN